MPHGLLGGIVGAMVGVMVSLDVIRTVDNLAIAAVISLVVGYTSTAIGVKIGQSLK